MKRIIPLLLFIAAPAVASADGWVYSVPEGNQWWDQGILEWTDPSGFHNVVSNITRSGTSLGIGSNANNPMCVNLDFSVGIEGDWQLTSIGGGTLGGSPVTNFVAPSTLKIINWGAFERNENLRSVVLNEGLETINQNAFMACTALESFSGLPSTLTSMSGGSFSGCTRLPGEIVWPAGVSKYDNTFPSTAISAFIATNGLKSIEGYAAFGDNSSTKVDMHVYFNNFPSRGFDGSLIDGAKSHAVTFHMEWSAKDDWNDWMETNGVFMVEAPETPYSKGELEHGTSWSDWRPRAYLMWWHTPIASVGGTDYTSLRAAIDAADGAPITLLAPSVADFTDERVSLAKNEGFAVIDDAEHVLGYDPGVPDAPGWKLAVSRQTRGETPVVVYKAVGPAMLIMMK